jgi:predicted amidohydrolase
MNEKLKISLLQSHIDWLDVDKNLSRWSEMINQVHSTDLIVLPEMFNTGFSMKPHESAEKADGKTVQWMLDTAKEKQTALMGSIAVEENRKYYNRLFFVTPQGKIEIYDKKHLFILSEENKNFEAGTELLTLEYLGWKIKPLICYDLRFPVWARNTENYDVLMYVANWPSARREQWLALLRARAIENQCFCIGLNRTGIDGNNYRYSGDTVVFNVLGETIYQAGTEEEIINIELNMRDLEKYRNYFPVLKTIDKFKFID